MEAHLLSKLLKLPECLHVVLFANSVCGSFELYAQVMLKSRDWKDHSKGCQTSKSWICNYLVEHILYSISARFHVVRAVAPSQN